MQFNAKAVTICCTDLERSAAFYHHTLGAVPLPRDGHGCRWYRLGDTLISLMPNAQQRTPSSFPNEAMTILWLETDNLANAHAHLLATGAQIIEGPNGPSMLIADPDGLLIEVWQKDT